MKPERLERGTISAYYLLADAPPDVVTIPKGFVIKHYPAMVARGARKPRMANRGDAPTTSHAANRDGSIMGNGQHQATRNLAAKGYR